MRQRLLTRTARHLRRVTRPPADRRLSDGELLERFVAGRDERAFADLVERHGPMVLGVCRRVTGDPHDADDAYQATFLVLMRRAAAVSPRDRVGPWLYGVACRAAREARSRAARRRSRERPTAELPQPACEPPVPQDWRPILDDELQRLPDRYRAAVVLCELEGRPRREAAACLGIPEGTLSSRLAAARRLLADRLTRRGVALSAAALAAALAQEAVAAAPPVEVISPDVLAITEGVVSAMSLTKLKLWTAAVLAVVALGTGVLLSPGLGAGPDRKPRPAAPPPVRAKAERQYQITTTFVDTIDGKRDVVSAPRLVVTEGQKAVVQIGGALPEVGGGVVEFVNVGLEAAFTVTPEKDGKLRIDVSIQQTRPVEDKAGPTWRTRSVRAVRQVTPGKAERMELPADASGQPALQVAFTVTPHTEDGSPLPPATVEADKEWRAAEFYRRIGHAGAARFHYDLLLRRYPDSSLAGQARERLKRLKDAGEPTKDEKPFRIGAVNILGNTKTPDRDILDRVTLFPGQVLRYADVQEAEARLAKMRAFKSPPKVTIRNVEEDAEYKDILIIVEEK